MAKPHQYRWKVGPWQKCSKDCGRGAQIRAVACFDSHRDARVAQFLCRMNVVKPKNERQCNVHRCTEGKWIRGEWSECSVTCGKVRFLSAMIKGMKYGFYSLPPSCVVCRASKPDR